MQRPATALFPAILAVLAVAGCSQGGALNDNFNLSVHNPTPAVQSRTQPTVEDGQDPYNRTVPQP